MKLDKDSFNLRGHNHYVDILWLCLSLFVSDILLSSDICSNVYIADTTPDYG